jgi:hypothetical protein
MMPERSILRVRERPHLHPDRAGELVVEVLRDGVVVATIYGSREGVHITSDRISSESKTVYFEAQGFSPGVIVPLLGAFDTCPWCGGDESACLLCVKA